MKTYRYVRALEGAPEGKIRRLSVQDAAPLLKSGAIVEHDADDDNDGIDAAEAPAEQSLIDRNERLTIDWSEAVQARDTAFVERDGAIAERNQARTDLDRANALLADTSQTDQLRADLDAALRRADQAEADLAALKAPPAPIDDEGGQTAAKSTKTAK